ncbi:MAG: squalene--hopene cyclase, partial [Planctomycetales bacterium]
HGLATFVLGQAHGMTNDARISDVMDRSLKLIANTQCEDGGWDYRSRRQSRGHDLSLAVMQAKALRSAVDSGLEVPPEIVVLALRGVREHYVTKSGRRGLDDPSMKKEPGQFTYRRSGKDGTIAMAAAGVVCLQEFGQYDDWRIKRNMEVITMEIKRSCQPRGARSNGEVPLGDAYTLYYVGQSLYQAGDGDPKQPHHYWRDHYPMLRDAIVRSQHKEGYWQNNKWVGGTQGRLYGTAVACFILAMPNRYLPILQEGKIESLKTTFGGE